MITHKTGNVFDIDARIIARWLRERANAIDHGIKP